MHTQGRADGTNPPPDISTVLSKKVVSGNSHLTRLRAGHYRIKLAWCREGESNPHSPFGPADFKLRRFAGVSPNEVRAGACSRNPERSWRGILLARIWCREGESNPHSPFGPADFKSAASANFAIPAMLSDRSQYCMTAPPLPDCRMRLKSHDASRGFYLSV